MSGQISEDFENSLGRELSKSCVTFNSVMYAEEVRITQGLLLLNYEKERIMTEQQQHCPGFEANKSLSEIKVKCSNCGKIVEIFSDEVGKSIKCSGCGSAIDTDKCQVK